MLDKELQGKTAANLESQFGIIFKLVTKENIVNYPRNNFTCATIMNLDDVYPQTIMMMSTMFSKADDVERRQDIINTWASLCYKGT